MQDYFYALSDKLFGQLKNQEILLLNFYGENSDFVRLNQNAIRQAGHVVQRTLNMRLVDGKRQVTMDHTLIGHLDDDLRPLLQVIEKLRNLMKVVEDDPYLLYAVENNSTEVNAGSGKELIQSREAINTIQKIASGLDLVGIFANGTMTTGFSNSLGQRNWHSNTNFNFDFSCYHSKDKAVKENYAGTDWSAETLNLKFQSVREQLAMVSRGSRILSPGQYRVYLAPAALQEILGILSWDGFGLKSRKTKQTSLIKMLEEDTRLNEAVSISENIAAGSTANFTKSGFKKPDNISLIRQGRVADCLVGARSGVEFGVTVNADTEYPDSLDVNAGQIHTKDILSELGTGIMINNLWYLNYSDRNFCQITGMTRFACFWVEGGQIKAPINVMRFDDSLYHLLGDNLLGLSKEKTRLFDSGSYGRRSSGSMRLPGALIENMSFTL